LRQSRADLRISRAWRGKIRESGLRLQLLQHESPGTFQDPLSHANAIFALERPCEGPNQDLATPLRNLSLLFPSKCLRGVVFVSGWSEIPTTRARLIDYSSWPTARPSESRTRVKLLVPSSLFSKVRSSGDLTIHMVNLDRIQRWRRSNWTVGRALVRLGYGGSGSEVGDSCYASRKMSAVGFGSRLLFFASTTRNSISFRSRRANDSAISRATSWWWSPASNAGN